MNYTPHESVLKHPAVERVFLIDYLKKGGFGLMSLASYIKRGKVDALSFEIRSLMMVIDWDMRTHYGLTDKELGPPL